MAGQPLLNVYLMDGADEFKREFLVERLTGRMSSLGDLDFNRDVFDGSSDSGADVVAACNTLPFACEYRLVLVKDVDRLAKADAEAIAGYLEEPCPTTVLAMTSTKLRKNSRLYKAVKKTSPKAVVDCSPKNRRDLPAQVRDFAAAEGLSITQDAATYLVELVGESTVHLDTELKKIAQGEGRGAHVDRALVDRYVARTSEVKPWDFTDALSSRDAARALTLFARMKQDAPFGLLTMSVNRIRELLVAKDLGTRDASVLAAELGKQGWQVRNHLRWADGFTADELSRALVSAAELEAQMKSGGDARALFEQWTVEVCTRF